MLSARELNSTSLPNRSWINDGCNTRTGSASRWVRSTKDPRKAPWCSSSGIFRHAPRPTSRSISRASTSVNCRTTTWCSTPTPTSSSYPEGDDNVSTRYDGTGGLELGGLFTRLLFSLKARSYEMLVSGQLNATAA